jgi:hypothetical protein
MANDDTTLEYKLAQKIEAKNILTVGGSGSRCLPFLALPINQLKIVDVFVCKLRKKLSQATNGEKYIETVWGRGYVLRNPEATQKEQKGIKKTIQQQLESV